MATLALSFVACSDDDEVGAEYNRASTISVVKSDVLFSASAGTGMVVVRAQGPISFESSSEWCKTTALNDSTVQVSVEANEQNSGRSSQITIKSGVDSVNVTVQQQGFYLQSDMSTGAVFGDEACREAFAFSTSGTPTITSTADWLSASVEGDSLVVTATSNETGHMRQGYIKYTFGSYKDSVEVAQYDFDKDLAGNYYFAYYDETGELSFLLGVLQQSDEGYVLSLPQLDFNIPVAFDATSHQLTISAGSYIGDYTYNKTAYPTYTILGSSEAGYLTWSKSVKYAATFEYDEEDGVTIAEFGDVGSWQYVVDYLQFYLFKSKTLSGANRFTDLVTMFEPFLQKMDDSAGARRHSFKAPAKLSILK